MGDDGVRLVPLHHADIEEAGIFAVHHRVHDASAAVAMVLRSLHETDAREAKAGTRSLSQSGLDDIVGVEHADDLGLGRGVLKRKPERAGLETIEPLGAKEFEARPQAPGNAPR